MTAFDEAWDFVKQGRWADDFRQWARQNMDMEWFDSEYGIGSAEDPEMGFNFDEWDFQIREVAHQALQEELALLLGDDTSVNTMVSTPVTLNSFDAQHKEHKTYISVDNDSGKQEVVTVFAPEPYTAQLPEPAMA